MAKHRKEETRSERIAREAEERASLLESVRPPVVYIVGDAWKGAKG